MDNRVSVRTSLRVKLSDTTPAELQLTASLRRRRWIMAVLNVATHVTLAAVMARIFAAGGWTAVDVIAFVCFLIASPWTVLGFWNAVIGLGLIVFARDPLARVAPLAPRAGERPIEIRTAVLMTIRNEDPVRAFAHFRAVKASLDRTAFADRFAYFILSDTSKADVAAAEEVAVDAWRRESGSVGEIIYRRRADNTGYKAGNLRDFCARWGNDYELMLPLDADSLMSAEAVVDMVRIMQCHPRLGILQSLVVGMPSSSAFARIFQFGMRHGMRVYTMGSAWWTGDCGPFWGHNALVRIAPFSTHCDVPLLSGKPPMGGHVLSHDQVEAALMRRAGYEVRVLPVECGSWEENPPTVHEFMERDLRWCLGNLQYLKLLNVPGLLPISRFQLAWAILMFVGLPAWTLMIALLPFAVAESGRADDYPGDLAASLYVVFLAMYLMPKFAGVLDVIVTRGGIGRYGGPLRFAASVVIELVFSLLQGAISTFRTTLFMIGLAFGKASVGWSGQARDAHRLPWRIAFEEMWPQLVFGIYVCGSLLLLSPLVLAWASPMLAGYLLAVPFAVWTASPALGRWLAAGRICAIPEEFDPPAVIAALRARADEPPTLGLAEADRKRA